MKIQLTAFSIFILISPTVFSDDTRYDNVRDDVFWPLLYDEDYETFYCAVSKAAGEKVTVEHVYPADWIAEAQGCDNRDNCPLDAYRTASSDLHNLWPALQRYNSSRNKLWFGKINGNVPRFPEDNCDFERTTGAGAMVEPRDAIKGEIARSMLYMIFKYGLPEHGQLELMYEWNRDNPPTNFEKERNKEIATLQAGGTNPFIDFWDN